MAGTSAITMYKGEDVVMEFTMSPVEDITGWTIQFNAAGAITNKAATITDAANGVFTVTLDDTDTDALAPGTYRYDVWRTDAGSEEVIAIGNFVVNDVERVVT